VLKQCTLFSAVSQSTVLSVRSYYYYSALTVTTSQLMLNILNERSPVATGTVNHRPAVVTVRGGLVCDML
jgi:hypothetical protein